MKRQNRAILSWCLCVLTLFSGCAPKQPYFFAEDGKILGKGDLSHYLDVATEIEYPDTQSCSIPDVARCQAPLTISNSENFDIWDLTLEEATRIMLTNSKVMRQLGGRVTDGGSNVTNSNPELLTQNPGNAPTVFDPALVESGNGTATGSAQSGTGVEAALSEFDATLDASVTWNENDRPQNFQLANPALSNFFAPLFQQDQANGTLGITKNTANGSTFSIRNNYVYDQNNNGSRIAPSDWLTNIEASFSQPFLQGAGTQYNRIAGFSSFQQASSGFTNQIDGVMIARIRHDIALTDFEEGVESLMRDMENVYWELYFAYRDLDAKKIGRDSALETWKKVKALKGVGTQGGEADKEAQARVQFFGFQAQVEAALTNLFRVENKLRYMMGLAATDSRLIRPVDEPVIAHVNFDWSNVLSEALVRRTELRSQKWQIKRREMELIAAKNHLLPRLDASGTYRWLGAGDDLLRSQELGVEPYITGSDAFSSLTSGRFQEWQLALQFTMPIGFRKAMSGVRHHQLLLAKERAVLEDMELAVTQQMTNAIRDIDYNFHNLQTRFSGRVASQDEVDVMEVLYDAGKTPIDLLLQAQQRRSEAESLYYRALVDYNIAIMLIHHWKGSLLEYNGVYLAEGPWPGKAHFDALRRARHRDASTFINYGNTRPGIITRGPYEQITGKIEGNEGQPEQWSTPTLVAPDSNLPDHVPTMPEEKLPTPELNGEDSAILLHTPIENAMYHSLEGGALAPSAGITLTSGQFDLTTTEVEYNELQPLPLEPEGSLRDQLPSVAAVNPFRDGTTPQFEIQQQSVSQSLSHEALSSNPLRSSSPNASSLNSVLRPPLTSNYEFATHQPFAEAASDSAGGTQQER